MAGLFDALNSARTSLEVNQKSIEVVGNNIANVNTEGYSRQFSQLAQYPSINFGNFFIGQGVKITDIQRSHDIFIQNQLVDKSADYGFENGQTQVLAELERIFAITDNNLATKVDSFFDSWQELSASPSDLVLRDEVIQRGDILANSFNATINDLNGVQGNINDSLSAKIADINTKIQELADLNSRIYAVEINGQSANTARDRRELLARQLAETVGAQSFSDSRGMMSVTLPGGLPLVQGTAAMELEAVSSGASLDIQLHTAGVTRTLNEKTIGGEFQGLLSLRDTFIPGVKDDIDRMAYEISTQVNSQHALGAGLDSVTGRNFFVDPPNLGASPPDSPWQGAARNIAVTISEAEEVAAAQAPTPPDTAPPGDNRNALLLADLDESYLVDGIDNFNSLYGKIVARIGLEANQNELSLQGNEDAVVQLNNLRDGLAGVSLEEEMIDLINYQRGFESSAKFLTTVDELMETLIAI
ncbi:MAG: flagellar hook-associated protein FlgK [Desulfopila sp.]